MKWSEFGSVSGLLDSTPILFIIKRKDRPVSSEFHVGFFGIQLWVRIYKSLLTATPVSKGEIISGEIRGWQLLCVKRKSLLADCVCRVIDSVLQQQWYWSFKKITHYFGQTSHSYYVIKWCHEGRHWIARLWTLPQGINRTIVLLFLQFECTFLYSN